MFQVIASFGLFNFWHVFAHSLCDSIHLEATTSSILLLCSANRSVATVDPLLADRLQVSGPATNTSLCCGFDETEEVTSLLICQQEVKGVYK